MRIRHARELLVFLLLPAILLPFLSASVPSMAQSDVQSETQAGSAAPDGLTEVYGDWTFHCGPEAAGCHVFQPLLRSEDRARLLQVTVLPARSPDGEDRLRVLTPLGADLAASVALEADGSALAALPFASCWTRGCVAEAALTPALEETIRAGEILSVSVVGADTGKTVRFELKLEGVGRALKRLAARE